MRSQEINLLCVAPYTCNHFPRTRLKDEFSPSCLISIPVKPSLYSTLKCFLRGCYSVSYLETDSESDSSLKVQTNTGLTLSVGLSSSYPESRQKHEKPCSHPLQSTAATTSVELGKGVRVGVGGKTANSVSSLFC